MKNLKPLLGCLVGAAALLAAIPLVTFLFGFLFISSLVSSCEQAMTEGTSVFEDTDFDDSSYAIIVNRDGTPVLIDDRTALKKSRREIRTAPDWMNFIPGEGRPNYFLAVFRDGLQTSKKVVQRAEKIMVPDSLLRSGIPVDRHILQGTRGTYLRQLAEARNLTGLYWEEKASIRPPNIDYGITIYSPIVELMASGPIYDDNGKQEKLRAYLQENLPKAGNYAITGISVAREDYPAETSDNADDKSRNEKKPTPFRYDIEIEGDAAFMDRLTNDGIPVFPASLGKNALFQAGSFTIGTSRELTYFAAYWRAIPKEAQ